MLANKSIHQPLASTHRVLVKGCRTRRMRDGSCSFFFLLSPHSSPNTCGFRCVRVQPAKHKTFCTPLSRLSNQRQEARSLLECARYRSFGCRCNGPTNWHRMHRKCVRYKFLHTLPFRGYMPHFSYVLFIVAHPLAEGNEVVAAKTSIKHRTRHALLGSSTASTSSVLFMVGINGSTAFEVAVNLELRPEKAHQMTFLTARTYGGFSDNTKIAPFHWRWKLEHY